MKFLNSRECIRQSNPSREFEVVKVTRGYWLVIGQTVCELRFCFVPRLVNHWRKTFSKILSKTFPNVSIAYQLYIDKTEEIKEFNFNYSCYWTAELLKREKEQYWGTIWSVKVRMKGEVHLFTYEVTMVRKCRVDFQ